MESRWLSTGKLPQPMNVVLNAETRRIAALAAYRMTVVKSPLVTIAQAYSEPIKAMGFLVVMSIALELRELAALETFAWLQHRQSALEHIMEMEQAVIPIRAVVEQADVAYPTKVAKT